MELFYNSYLDFIYKEQWGFGVLGLGEAGFIHVRQLDLAAFCSK